MTVTLDVGEERAVAMLYQYKGTGGYVVTVERPGTVVYNRDHPREADAVNDFWWVCRHYGTRMSGGVAS